MEFDLDQRTATLSVGEFAGFSLGPHDPGSGNQGIWRAQIGTHWHQQLRQRVADEHPSATFEVTIAGRVYHRGWTLHLAGRIDQLIPASVPPPPSKQQAKTHALRDPASTTASPAPPVILREIKTVMRPLPADEADLRQEHPEYFAQTAAYLKLRRDAEPASNLRAELLFLEVASGLAQTVALSPTDDALYQGQLERVVEFLNLRLRARERLQHLHFRPAFATPRPGQETTLRDLTAAFERHPAVLFEAPTGFGKTGVMLEFALGQLQSGHFDRILYLTSKSTGQLQVVRQLTAMTTPDEQSRAEQRPNLALWHVRNKAEHCINHTFHCVSDNCRYLDDIEARWPESGLARFYRFEDQARDLDTLRQAGQHARICPYEITRAALAFNDVWIGDYNYVFAPANRGLFYLQPGFDPARTLLIVDEAHNLPSRVADAYSHEVRAADARALLAELDHLRAPAPLVRAWESYTLLLSALLPTESLDPALEADLTDTLRTIAELLAGAPLDYAALGPQFSDQLWRVQEMFEWLQNHELRKLLWCPHEGELAFTCLDAAAAIGETLHAFGGLVLASATLSPVDTFAESCGLDLAHAPVHLTAATPWREGAYNVAVDLRVDTRFQHRSRHYADTAGTIRALQASASGPVVVFFPSYAYAEAIEQIMNRSGGLLRVALQPRLRDLAAQTAWVEESLAFADALFLVLGSSFAESIDLLGGRISHAMVVGPALPEVNPVQHAKMRELDALGRDGAFRRVYQIPGMQKVNQALGRLVRAPGQKARVLLHCQRFGQVSYASLLARDYQFGTNLATDADLAAWLGISN